MGLSSSAAAASAAADVSDIQDAAVTDAAHDLGQASPLNEMLASAHWKLGVAAASAVYSSTTAEIAVVKVEVDFCSYA